MVLSSLPLVFAGFATCHAALITVPSASQLRYQSTDFVALIHFNIETFAHNTGCDSSNWNTLAPYATGKTRDPATFYPKKLNTTQWMESITGLGANIAVLTAKHGCGFTLWPSKAKFLDGRPYNYSVGIPGASIQYDVLRKFVDSAQDAGVGHGFYYSIMKNFYLCHDFNGKHSCLSSVLPGQQNISEEEYLHMAKQQVTELWTQYGNITRIWVDSGLGGLGPLMDQLQPQAAGTPLNPIDWCGTESGYPSRDVGSGDIWSTGHGYFGQANGTQWVPKYCDPQLFREHVWFWEPSLHVRSLAEMIPIYHDIVGRGMVMELAFSIDRDGLVEESHAKVYRQLGQWVQQCYASPLAVASGKGYVFNLFALREGQMVDRFQIQEGIVMGQRVRNYTIERSSSNGWVPLVSASAIGRKRIHLLPKSLMVSPSMMIRLRIENAIAEPSIKQFSAFAQCPDEMIPLSI